MAHQAEDTSMVHQVEVINMDPQEVVMESTLKWKDLSLLLLVLPHHSETLNFKKR
jgi:hypothetical protein